MSNTKGGKRGFRNYNKQQTKQQNKREVDEINEDNPILNNFKKYSKELDDKHDRYERIVKLGRDITIESKRIIFLLHTIDARKGNTENVLQEAAKRLQILCDNDFHEIAKEIGNLDPYQYCRAYSAGLQEFIEAYTFYQYLCKNQLSDWDDLQLKLLYQQQTEQKITEQENNKNEENKNVSNDVECSTENDVEEKFDKNENSEDTMKLKYFCHIQPIEFVCGLADVGGEMMRRCINSLGSGDIQTCFETCKSLQELYAGYLGITAARSRDLSRKIYTLRQSVLKAEDVCYNVKVRGGEAAKWGSITTDPQQFTEKHFDDEGFF